MFGKLLIANRGEIACRVIRTAKRLGIATVAVYSEADAGALHTQMADEACPLGPAPAAESYLAIAKIIAAARQSGAGAIHPGYGFLSESADFAAACEAAGIVFIGPPPAAIRAMGSKAAAKTLMAKAGVPLVPGYHGKDQSDKRLAEAAREIGFPVLLKASAGGGGKGMRVVATARGLAPALASARREAASAFGDDRLLIEKYLTRPRHIEVQIFADRHGNAVHLFERDCSIQRRHQKVIEEAPAPDLDETPRAMIGRIALQAARAVGYVGAGTVEFIAEGAAFYFIEMNTRLQVEHAVTEMITGLDLVEWQIRIAGGEALPLGQNAIRRTGHAVEARLYAEDPARDFLPSPGRLALLRLPEEAPDLRVETGLRQGDRVTTFYDPMIAKVIAHAATRGAALARLHAALSELRLAGTASNRDLLLRLLSHPEFVAGALDTGFIERHRALLLGPQEVPFEALVAAAIAPLLARQAAPSGDPYSPWRRRDGWRLDGAASEAFCFRAQGDAQRQHVLHLHYRPDHYHCESGGSSAAVSAALKPDGDLDIALDGRHFSAGVLRQGAEIWVVLAAASYRLVRVAAALPAGRGVVAPDKLVAPMPGRVSEVLVSPGSQVKRGQVLMLLEAMKMEHAIEAPADGKVAAVHFAAGDLVEEGAELLVVTPVPA